jgi:prepilin-type N-terminal cleavage/methylation domain-containing protein
MSSNTKGFTLVELLIAMAFFTFLLMLVTFGFVQINRSYTKGITVKTIQETARTLSEDISRAIRTTDDYTYISPDMDNDGNLDDPASDVAYRLCLSGVRYGWNQHIEQPQPPANSNETLTMTDEKVGAETEPLTMVRSFGPEACGAGFTEDNAEKVLDDRAAVQHLSIEEVGGAGANAYRISVVISTRQAAEEDLAVFGKNAACNVGIGDQFCDVASLTTVVQSRN